MNRKPFLASVGVCAAAWTIGCSDPADGSVRDGNTATGFSNGGSPPSGGGVQGTGGAVQSNGGFDQGTGGVVQNTGGLMQGTGGFVQGTGGVVQSTGGLMQGTGGLAQGTGGLVQGTGGLVQGTGGAPVAGSRPPCMKNPKQIISLGDSYMNWVSHTFPTDLDAAFGTPLRPTYAIGAYSMGSGGIGLIPTQLDTALAADPDIIAVVLDGGGNDVLVAAPGRPDCKNMANAATVPGCQAIVTDALTAAEKLMTRLVDAGVHDVIYFFYPHVPQPTLVGGSYPNAMLDYALPLVKAFCDGANAKTGGKGNCWFIDTVPIFAGHSDWFAPTDIHENSTGSKAIAQAIVDTMKAHCVGQPASSGCCEP